MRTRSGTVIAVLIALSWALVSACSRPQTSVPVSAATDQPPGTLLVDFPARVDSGVFRRGGPVYDFGKIRRERFVGEGWSTPERTSDGDSWFTWAMSETASVRLRVLDAHSSWLHFAAYPFDLDPSIAQTATVRLNDVEVGTVTLEPGPFVPYSLSLPDGALIIGDNLVSFDFAYARSPSELTPGHEDTRRLAAAFDYVAITPDDDPPADPELPEGTDGLRSARDRLSLPNGSETSFSVLVPPAGALDFAVAADTMTEGSAMRAEVAIRRLDAGEEIFFAERPASDPARWRADLSRWVGERVALVFRAVGGQPGDRVAWIEPRLHGDPGELNITSNVVLIVVDTLRADALGVYGGDTHTPTLDALARSGVRFERAYSHVPITVPSHSSMFTSLLPTEHAARNNGSILGEDHSTLAELLRDHYRWTAGFVSLGVLKRAFGVAQGFEEYHDEFDADWWKSAEEMNRQLIPWLESHPSSPFFLWAHYSDPHEPYGAPGRTYTPLAVTDGGETVAELVADGTTSSVRLELAPGISRIVLTRQAPGSRPAVRLSNLRATHPDVTVTCEKGCRMARFGPNADDFNFVTALPATLVVDNPTAVPVTAAVRLQASEFLSVREARVRYREEVEYLDAQLAELLQAIEAVSDDTLIILTADHGEDLGEHGSPGHVSRLYESVIRVPLLVSWPGRVPAGRVVDDVVSHVDLLPTLLDLLAIPDAETRSGRSLAPLVTGASDGLPPVPVVVETFRPESPRDRRALVDGRFKLILTPEDSREELYDLEQDPGELENLAATDADTTASLTEILRMRVARAEAGAASPQEQTLTEEQLDQLRSLGYVR